MITPCHSLTADNEAGRRCGPRGLNGGPIRNSMAQDLTGGRPGPLSRKQMPMGTTGAPVSSDNRAAPRRPRSSWVGSRLTSPSGKNPTARPAAKCALARSSVGRGARKEVLRH
jgi:hypothetical protein